MNILGISAFYHDSAACLLRDGEVIAAASEERFTRKKHDSSFPANASQFVLERGGIGVKEIDAVGFTLVPGGSGWRFGSSAGGSGSIDRNSARRLASLSAVLPKLTSNGTFS